ncbi:MAG TPA: hypothetical protein DEA96_03750 [Leptospiraceae bacterium]|nr:hypothetical protein [Leptospiraceae bacterium]|tara:strand:- start:7602 stop:7904 length:303 start_codon:yes stop_codon:yes gene_type:complete
MNEETLSVTDWRRDLSRIVSEMLDAPSPEGIYPTTECLDRLEQQIAKAVIYGVGWGHADACADIDNKRDPRAKDLGDMLRRAKVDLGLSPREDAEAVNAS